MAARKTRSKVVSSSEAPRSATGQLTEGLKKDTLENETLSSVLSDCFARGSAPNHLRYVEAGDHL